MSCTGFVNVLAICYFMCVVSAVRIPLKAGIYLECGETEMDATTVTVIETNLIHSEFLSYTDIRLVCKNNKHEAFLQTNQSELVAQLHYTSGGNSTGCHFNDIQATITEPAKYEARIEFYTNDLVSDQLTFSCPIPNSSVTEPSLQDPVTVAEGVIVDCAQQTKGPAILVVSSTGDKTYPGMDVECKDGNVFLPEKTVRSNHTFIIFYEGNSSATCVFRNPSPSLYTIDLFLFQNVLLTHNYTVSCIMDTITSAPPTSPSVSSTFPTMPSTQPPTPSFPSVISLEETNTSKPTISPHTEWPSVTTVSVPSIRQQYILDVEPHCAVDPVGSSYIVITTDLETLEARVICKGGDRYPFWSQDGVHYEVNVFFREQSFKCCIFNKRVDADIYNVHVDMSWGEPEGLVHTVEKRFQVTCTYDDKLHLVSGNSNVLQGMVAPKEIQQHMGFPANTFAVLYLADVLGRKIPANNLYLGRTVQLIASTNGSDGELGIKPVACDAIGALSGKRYAILRGGCGDGIIFRKRAGFVTDGLLARSPYFSAFHLSGDADIKFECNVTLCPFACDSSSCSTQRRKRSLGYVPLDQNRPMKHLMAIETDVATIGHLNGTKARFSKYQDGRKKLYQFHGAACAFCALLIVSSVCVVVIVVENVWIRLFRKHNVNDVP